MIQLRNISKEFHKNESISVLALRDVNLDIQPGEFVAISGPSGSGKSTLMNIMGLLDVPTRGSYLLEDQEVSGLDIDALAKLRNQKIGFVFQSFHLLPRTSARENVELPLIYSDRSDIKNLALQSLEAVGLGERVSHFPSELSGGEQQRVAIARSLVNEPDIIFADEPTGNLDTRSGLEIISIFQELNARGKTIILVTHDQQIAEHCRRIVRISDGTIQTDDVVVQPRNAFEELNKIRNEPELPSSGVGADKGEAE
jgi:putative ABC transport system ATP-binding protein